MVRTLGIGVKDIVFILVIILPDDARRVRIIIVPGDGHTDPLDGLSFLILDGSDGLEIRMGLSIHEQSLFDGLFLSTRGEPQQPQDGGRQLLPDAIDSFSHYQTWNGS